jgi:HEAT repeat protein
VLEHLEVAAALEDPAPEVRRRACELAGRLQFIELAPQLTDALRDCSAVVVEAACYALGELEGLCAEGPEGPGTGGPGSEGPCSEGPGFGGLGLGGPGFGGSGLGGPDDRRTANGEPAPDAAKATDTAVRALTATATSHPEPLCREAAVAALGSLRSPAGLQAVLAALDDKPAVRRRAVVALAGFEGPEVDAALAKAAGDVDWQVRQVAEDLGGHRA